MFLHLYLIINPESFRGFDFKIVYNHPLVA